MKPGTVLTALAEPEPPGENRNKYPTVGWTGKTGNVRLEIRLLYYCETVFVFYKERVGGKGIIESDLRKNLLSESKGLNPEVDLPTIICFLGIQ